jgi:hypothetical protein
MTERAKQETIIACGTHRTLIDEKMRSQHISQNSRVEIMSTKISNMLKTYDLIQMHPIKLAARIMPVNSFVLNPGSQLKAAAALNRYRRIPAKRSGRNLRQCG